MNQGTEGEPERNGEKRPGGKLLIVRCERAEILRTESIRPLFRYFKWQETCKRVREC